jgi:hypothetical protein
MIYKGKKNKLIQYVIFCKIMTCASCTRSPGKEVEILMVAFVTRGCAFGRLLFLDPFSIKLLGRPLTRDVPIFSLILIAL